MNITSRTKWMGACMFLLQRQPMMEDRPVSRELEGGEETTGVTMTSACYGQYFNLNSTVRSTAWTGAIVHCTEGGDKSSDNVGGNTIPPQVLRAFSLLLLSQFMLFLGMGAVIPMIPLYRQSIRAEG